jgi:hypothetical protein
MMEIIDTNLEQKVSKILTLIQQYQAISQYEESLKQYCESLGEYNKLEGYRKRLKHIQEVCRRPVQDHQIVAIEGDKATITFGD